MVYLTALYVVQNIDKNGRISELEKFCILHSMYYKSFNITEIKNAGNFIKIAIIQGAYKLSEDSLRHNLSGNCRKIAKFVSMTHSERNIWNGPMVATAISRKKSKPVLEGKWLSYLPSVVGHPGHQT